MPTTAFGADALHIETDGPATGDPLLVLHGWGSSAQLMRPIAAAFSDTYRICNVDLPVMATPPHRPNRGACPNMLPSSPNSSKRN